MNDDELISRLQRATADVPASHLDLESVLRSSRRKRLRHRSTVAAGCVAAVAGVGAVTPAVAGFVDDGGSPVASGGAAGDGTAVCGVQPVEVDWTGEGVGPRIREVVRVEIDADGEVHRDEPVDFYPEPILDAAGAPQEVREAILDIAAEQDAAGIYRDGDLVDEFTKTSFTDGSGGGESDLPLSGYLAAQDAPPSTPSIDEKGMGPGTYLAYDRGEFHAVYGTAGCGQQEWSFGLLYEAPAVGGMLDCAAPVDELIPWALKESLCPTGATDAETDTVWSDDQGPEGVEQDFWSKTRLDQLGLPAASVTLTYTD